MAPLRGQANKPVGIGHERKQVPSHRNKLDSWELAHIHRHPNFTTGDEQNVRGLAATGSRVGSHIPGTRPDLRVA